MCGKMHILSTMLLHYQPLCMYAVEMFLEMFVLKTLTLDVCFYFQIRGVVLLVTCLVCL